MRADILAALVFSVFCSAPPTVCLLHLLHWWIQPKAAMPWVYFWVSGLRKCMQAGRMIRRPRHAPHAAGNAMPGSASSSKPLRSKNKVELGLAGYLQKILTARVYDVAI